MNDVELRVKCLELAVDRLRSAGAHDPLYQKDVMEVAKAMYDWAAPPTWPREAPSLVAA